MNLTSTFLLYSKYIAAGLAVSSISGAGVGIGFIFGGLAIAHNPLEIDTLFSYAIFGSALVKAIALFNSMISFFKPQVVECTY